MSTAVSTAVAQRLADESDLIRSRMLELSRVFCHQNTAGYTLTHVGHGCCVEDDRASREEEEASLGPIATSSMRGSNPRI